MQSFRIADRAEERGARSVLRYAAQRNPICKGVEVIITNAVFYRDRSSNPNNIRRRSRTGSIVLIAARHAGDIRETLNRLSHVVVRVRDLIVIANHSIVAHAFDQVDGFLAAPTDRPMTIAACGHKDRFALGYAVGVSHGTVWDQSP